MVQNEIPEFKIFSNSIDEYKYSKRNPNPMFGLRENRGEKKTNKNNKHFHFYAISYLLLPRTKKKKHKENKINPRQLRQTVSVSL